MNHFKRIGESPSIINCVLKYTKNTVQINASDTKGNCLSSIRFSAKQNGTESGLEIMKAGILATIIGKFRKAMIIYLDFDLDYRSFDFLQNLKSAVLEDLEEHSTPILIAKKLIQNQVERVISIEDDVFIGNSGGRDSFTSSQILSYAGFNLYPFRINYDQISPTDDYSTFEQNFLQEEDPTKYEPFDIPITYFAPLWPIKDICPRFIAIGHSFDVLGFDSNQRKAPYESPSAIRIHQEYLNAMFNNAIEFIFPISTLSTYSVFEYIRKKYGLKTLEEQNSCWNSTHKDCGYCEKCQRIKLAASGINVYDYQYISDVPQVLHDDSYLLGNPVYNTLVEDYGRNDLANSQLFSPNTPINYRITDYLYKEHTSNYHDVNSALLKQPQPQVSSTSTDKISKSLGIDYNNLPTSRVNHLEELLPYEEFFARDIPVLAAHGEIPYYIEGAGWKYHKMAEGPRLEIPDIPIFRRILSNN